MKLVIVLMLSALPLYCYAGSGCELLESVISKTVDPAESKTQYIEDLKQYIPGPITEKALKNLKQCYLSQNNETLSNVNVMMESIYNSKQCASY